MPSSTACDRSSVDRVAPGRTRRPDTGQAAVEFALALPLLVLALLALAQVAVVVRNEVAVELAAREGVRAASVSAAPTTSAARAATRAVALPIDVSTSVTGDAVTVTVTYVDHTDIAIIGSALGPITHRATATMALEPP